MPGATQSLAVTAAIGVAIVAILFVLGVLTFDVHDTDPSWNDNSSLRPQPHGCLKHPAACTCVFATSPPPSATTTPGGADWGKPHRSSAPSSCLAPSGASSLVASPPVVPVTPICYTGSGDFPVVSVGGKAGRFTYSGTCLMYNGSFLCMDVRGTAVCHVGIIKVVIDKRFKGFARLLSPKTAEERSHCGGTDGSGKEGCELVAVPCPALKEALGQTVESFCFVARPSILGCKMVLSSPQWDDTICLSSDQFTLPVGSLHGGQCGTCSFSAT
jgi:hypothetical protein